MPQILNWQLLANPYNWLLVYLIVAFFALGVTVLHAHATQGS